MSKRSKACEIYGIETKPQAEIESLLKEWDKK